jgi:hypothetical protein
MKPTNLLEAPVDLLLVAVTRGKNMTVPDAFERHPGMKPHPALHDNMLPNLSKTYGIRSDW